KRFIDVDTFLVVRVRLDKFDIGQVHENIKDIVKKQIQQMGFDENSMQRIEKALDDSLMLLLSEEMGTYENFLKETGITDLWMIFSKKDNYSHQAVIIPISGFSEDQAEALSKVIEKMDLGYKPLEEKFLFVLPGNEDETLEFFSKIEEQKNEEIDTYFAENSEAAIQLILLPFDVPAVYEILSGADFSQFIDKEGERFKPLSILFKNAFRQITFDWDIRNVSEKLEIQFRSERTAKAALSEMEDLIDYLAAMYSQNAIHSLRNEFGNEVLECLENYKGKRLFYEYVRGLTRFALLPVQQDNRVVFSSPILAPSLYTAGMAGYFLAPSIMGAVNSASRIQCTNNLKQLGIALHNFIDSNSEKLPPPYLVDEDNKPLHSWRTLILPYIEQSGLYDQIRLNEPWDSEWNSQFHDKMPAVFGCPEYKEDNKKGITHYALIVDEKTPFYRPAIIKNTGKDFDLKPCSSLANITDGTSNTLAIVEQKRGCCWMDPSGDMKFEFLENGVNGSEEDGLGSKHEGGVNVLIMDGSVRFIEDKIDLGILKAAATKSGGETKYL
ncbi:MAG: DUF1559 domain-containing protein, partial [Planctomycetia bacterium]|nr:DUF1559 domain-containing protein [Planctomycetia bacterium]